MSNPNPNPNPNPFASLPPGFRFYPTDEELILHYLRIRASSTPSPASIIAEVDIYKFDPWHLPGLAKFGDREWYFFSPRDRKYPNGVRPNRAAASGYWKATGTDKPIYAGNVCVGVKKALVFYTGRPPKGLKTNWIMHEYRLSESGNANAYKPIKLRDHSMRLDDWVLCRIYQKSGGLQSSVHEQEDSGVQESVIRLPRSSSVSDLLGDYSAFSHLFDAQPDLPVSDFVSLPAGPSCNQPYVNGDGNGVCDYFASRCLETEYTALRDQISPNSKRRRTAGGGCPEASKRQGDSCLDTDFASPFDAPQYSFFNQQQQLNSAFGLR